MYDVKFRKCVINYYYKYIDVSFNIVNDIIDIFSICSSTLYNWIKLYKTIGHLIPNQPGRPINCGKINDVITKYIIKRYTVNKKSNMDNLIRSIKRIFDVVIKKSTVYNVLHKNNITYKKITKCHSPFSNKEEKERRQALRKELNIKEDNIKEESFSHNNVISIDESFMSISTLTKEYEWSKKGIRSCRKINGRRYRHGKSMLLAISNKKVVGYKLVNGPVNGEIFYNFLINDIIKEETGLNILLDNARIHHYKKIKEKIMETENKLSYNVPYHPEYNPVEYINNIIKVYLKNEYINDINKMENKLIGIINKKINESILENCFNHAYKSISVS